MMKGEKFDYDFKVESHTDYKLVMTLKGRNRLMKNIFNMTMRQLKKKKAKNLSQGAIMQKLNEFKIPAQYLKLIKTGVKSVINGVKKEIHPDGIEILTYNVQEAKFQKRGSWYIILTVTGQYVDKR